MVNWKRKETTFYAQFNSLIKQRLEDIEMGNFLWLIWQIWDEYVLSEALKIKIDNYYKSYLPCMNLRWVQTLYLIYFSNLSEMLKVCLLNVCKFRVKYYRSFYCRYFYKVIILIFLKNLFNIFSSNSYKVANQIICSIS